MLKLLASVSPQLITLLSVIIGGLITFFSSFFLEKKRNKWQLKIRNLDIVLIPFCKSIEHILKDVESFQKGHLNHGTLLKSFSTLTDYLQVSNNIYLNRNVSIQLANYKDKLIQLSNTLESESSTYETSYAEYISKKLVNCTIFGNLEVGDIEPLFYTNSKEAIKKALLHGTFISLLSNISMIQFSDGNDDPSPLVIDISRNNQRIYDDTSGCVDHDIEQATLLWDYLDAHTFDETETFSTIIEDTKSHLLLISLVEMLDEMHTEQMNEIKKITK